MLYTSLLLLPFALLATAAPADHRDRGPPAYPGGPATHQDRPGQQHGGFFPSAADQAHNMHNDPISLTTMIWDLEDMHKSICKLNSTLGNYTGSWESEQPVYPAIANLHDRNRKSWHDATARRSAFSSADSKTIVDHSKRTVGASIPSMVETLKANKVRGFSNKHAIVVAGLKALKHDFDDWAGAMQAKLTGQTMEQGTMMKQVDDSLISGISHFGG